MARTASDLAAAVDEVKADGRAGLPVVADLAEVEDLEQAAQRTRDELGPVRVLVNAAGTDAPAAAFAPDSPYGGDHEMVRTGRIDPGRLELHQAVERQLAATGDDYDHALTVVLDQARAGTIALSQQALEGTGIVGVRAGRNGLQHHPVTGEVITLAGAPVDMPLGEPLPDPEDTALWRDTVAYCESQRPGASEAPYARSVEHVMARTGPTAGPQVQRWLSQVARRRRSADGQPGTAAACRARLRTGPAAGAGWRQASSPAAPAGSRSGAAASPIRSRRC
jgi:hypothetical protein